VSKQYDVALTSHQRLIKITSVSPATIEQLEVEYLTLGPVKLMAELKRLQHNLFQFAWYNDVQADVVTEEAQANDETAQETVLDDSTKIDYFNYNRPQTTDHRPQTTDHRPQTTNHKPKNKLNLPRNYRTRIDPFEQVLNEIQLKLELQPETYVREIIEWLANKYPGKFSKAHTRTLQRRIQKSRIQTKGYEEKMSELMF
jgi:hypothetical protein